MVLKNSSTTIRNDLCRVFRNLNKYMNSDNER